MSFTFLSLGINYILPISSIHLVHRLNLLGSDFGHGICGSLDGGVVRIKISRLVEGNVSGFTKLRLWQQCTYFNFLLRFHMSNPWEEVSFITSGFLSVSDCSRIVSAVPNYFNVSMEEFLDPILLKLLFC